MQHDTSKWTIDTFFQMEGSRQLQLQPDFQRFYIWDLRKEVDLNMVALLIPYR